MQMIMVAWFSVGFALALVVCYLTLKYRVEVSRDNGHFLVLKLPFLGKIGTRFRVKYPGIFLDEWEDLEEKLLMLNRLVEPKILLSFAKEYQISYLGFEGDRPDGEWSEGKLAYSLITQDYRGYSVFLNPDLDVKEVSKILSRTLRETVLPSEVQTFLFLHEIGHTLKAGNSNYLSTLIDHSFYDGETATRRTCKIIILQRRIERFSDKFALRELHRLRKAGTLGNRSVRGGST